MAPGPNPSADHSLNVCGHTHAVNPGTLRRATGSGARFLDPKPLLQVYSRTGAQVHRCTGVKVYNYEKISRSQPLRSNPFVQLYSSQVLQSYSRTVVRSVVSDVQLYKKHSSEKSYLSDDAYSSDDLYSCTTVQLHSSQAFVHLYRCTVVQEYSCTCIPVHRSKRIQRYT